MKRLIRNLVGYLKVLLISITGYAQSNITQAEYFFDTDPGHGNGTAIALGTPAIDKAALSFSANVASLTTGIHTLYVRSKNANGSWSQTSSAFFAKVQSLGANPNTAGNITAAEYFFDTDPGIGNGSGITITSGADLSGLTFNVNVGTVTNGIHTLFIRTKDANGWSITQRLLFVKYQPLSGNPHTVSNITRAEYFYDTDPGYGNGTSISVTPSANLSALVFNASVSSLATGVHTMYIRTADAQGQWSETEKLTFAKFQPLSGNPNTASNIVNAEYFFNTDPGVGNGIPVPVAAANDINGLVINADISTLPSGLHTIYLRTEDAQGKWSVTRYLQFSKIQGLQPNPHPLSRINKAEYFYDTDPGYGNGTDIPIVPSYDINQLAFNADVSTLVNGVHTMYVRTRDSLGQWSEVSRVVFAKVQALGGNPHTISNIVRVEYFVDTDPGPGNGISVPLAAASDVSSISFNVDMTVLVNGAHTLFVRSKDAEGKWSITNMHTFNGGTAPLAMKLLSFDAFLQETGTVLLEWVVAEERNVARYTIERSSNASDWTLVGSLPPSSSGSSQTRYRLTDEEPGTGLVYYRLTETDMAGRSTQAPIRFVRISNSQAVLSKLYPNPNDGKRLTITSPLFASGQVSLAIFSVDGKVHLLQTFNDISAESVTLSGLVLPSGNYFVLLKTGQTTETLSLQINAERF